LRPPASTTTVSVRGVDGQPVVPLRGESLRAAWGRVATFEIREVDVAVVVDVAPSPPAARLEALEARTRVGGGVGGTSRGVLQQEIALRERRVGAGVSACG